MRNESEREIRDYINDAIEECNYLANRSKNESFDTYIKNEDLKRSFVRSIEVISEAIKKIPDNLKSKNIPWKDISGMRNIIAHEYFGIDHQVVWKTVKNNIPLLKKELESISESLENEKSKTKELDSGPEIEL